MLETLYQTFAAREFVVISGVKSIKKTRSGLFFAINHGMDLYPRYVAISVVEDKYVVELLARKGSTLKKLDFSRTDTIDELRLWLIDNVRIRTCLKDMVA